MPAPGQRFGRYAVEAPVAQGGMGVVFRARDVTLDRPVALKIMLDDGDPESKPRFLREARLAASLDHPSIVAIYDVGEVGGTPFLAMQWIEGRSLRVATRELSSAAKLDLLRHIAEAVAYAHARGIVHRDLKPSNILVTTREGAPILLDFGIAKRVAGPSTFETRTDVILGTPSYMAPEQMTTSRVDARADQFAWGVIAYELLAGAHPRTRVHDVERPYPVTPPPRLLDVPGHVADAVARAMAFVPEERFASMRELLTALQRPAAPPAPPPPRAASPWIFVATTTIVVAAGGAAMLASTRARNDQAVGPPPPSASASAAPTAPVEAPPPPPPPPEAPSTAPRASAVATVRAVVGTLAAPAYRFIGNEGDVAAANRRASASFTTCMRKHDVHASSSGHLYARSADGSAAIATQGVESVACAGPCVVSSDDVLACAGPALRTAGFPRLTDEGTAFGVDWSLRQ